MIRSSTIWTAVATSFIGISTAVAQVQLRATLDKGREFRYTLVLDQHFVTSFTPADKPPTERITRFELGTILRVIDVTPAGARVELKFDSVKGKIDPANGASYEFDTSVAPKTDATKDAVTFYTTGNQIIAKPQTFLVKPDGTIDEFKPDEETMKLGGARLLRRILEADGIKHNFGPVFALRNDGQAAKPTDAWGVKHILLADRGRQEVDEVRRFTKLEGNAATITSEVRATGAPAGNVSPGAIYLRDVTAKGQHTWDAAGSSLVSSKYEDSITFIMMLPNDARNEMTTITTTTLTPRNESASSSAPAAAAPAPATPAKK